MKAGGNTLVGDRRLLMTRPRSQQRSRIRPRRVLIVEDDLVIALMMEEIVREMGFSSIQLRVLVEQLVGSVPSGGGAAQTA